VLNGVEPDTAVPGKEPKRAVVGRASLQIRSGRNKKKTTPLARRRLRKTMGVRWLLKIRSDGGGEIT
jgi:hypothetical protein